MWSKRVRSWSTGVSTAASFVVALVLMPVSGAVATPPPQAETERYIVQFRSGVAPSVAVEVLDVAEEVTDTFDSVFVGAAVDLTAEQRAELQSDPTVLRVVHDTSMAAPDDVVAKQSTSASRRRTTGAQSAPPWGLDRSDQRTLPLSSSRESGFTGAGVTAYVIDSGVRADHVEFTGRMQMGFFQDDGPTDCDGHGTHVAGSLAGATVGIAPGVAVVPVRVLDCAGAGRASGIIAGLDWIVAHHQPGVPAVMNMSVGGPANLAVDAAVQRVISDGIVVTVAAGNDGTNACFESPARLAAAITVAATDATDWSPDWSNFGSCVDLFAPGDDVYSSWGAAPTAYELVSGTSMAAPHVAGAAALVLERNPGFTPAQVTAQLFANATTGVVQNRGTSTPDRLLYVPPTTVVPVTPARILDTRPGTTTVDGRSRGMGAAVGGSITPLQVTGRGGVPVGVPGVVLNVTATQATGDGFVTVFPCGIGVPNASTLNFVTGATVPNSVTVQLDAVGRVCLFSNVATHLLVDVNAYYPSGSSFTAVSPQRLLDTRSGTSTVDGVAAGIGIRPEGSVTELQVGGRAGLPSSIEAVVLNVTATDAAADGFVTVYPCGAGVPNSSNLNVRSGSVIANAVTAQVDGTGKVCLYASSAMHLLADVGGWLPVGSSFDPSSPQRLLDTRPGASTVDGQGAGSGLAAGGGSLELQITGRQGLAAGTAAVVLNVTVTESAAEGFVTVYPCGGVVPLSSNLNFGPGATVANAVMAQVGANGRVCLFTNVPTHLIADLNGWFPG